MFEWNKDIDFAESIADMTGVFWNSKYHAHSVCLGAKITNCSTHRLTTKSEQMAPELTNESVKVLNYVVRNSLLHDCFAVNS
jgi:hypothetical protein